LFSFASPRSINAGVYIDSFLKSLYGVFMSPKPAKLNTIAIPFCFARGSLPVSLTS